MVDDFTCVNTDGSLVTSKAQEMASLIGVAARKAKSGGSTETTEQKLRTFGDTAIFTDLTQLVQKSPTGQTRDITFRRMSV
jgi:hypothetical protein